MSQNWSSLEVNFEQKHNHNYKNKNTKKCNGVGFEVGFVVFPSVCFVVVFCFGFFVCSFVCFSNQYTIKTFDITALSH